MGQIELLDIETMCKQNTFAEFMLYSGSYFGYRGSIKDAAEKETEADREAETEGL